MKKQYKCQFCGEEFERNVIYEAGEKFSTQVKCPRCLNLIPTWRKELTGNVEGNKHIHFGRGN